MKKLVIIIISILVISAIVGGIVFLNSKETEGTNNNTNTSQMYEQDKIGIFIKLQKAEDKY